MKRQHEPGLIYINTPSKAAELIERYGRSKNAFVENWISHLPEPMHLVQKYPKTIEKGDSSYKKQLGGKREDNFNQMELVSFLYNMKVENLNPLEISENSEKLEALKENTKYSESEYSWSSDLDSCMEVYSLVDFPPDCVVYGQHFTEFSIESILNHKTDELKIKICSIVGPMRFWFIIENGEESFLSQLKEMKKFYDELKDMELKMASSHVFPRQVCIVQLDHGCVRGIIQSYLMGSNVKVFLVDFGCSVRVPPSSLKYLKNEYMKIPRQALRGAVVNVEPIEPWTSAEKKDFYSLMSRKSFMAKIMKIKKAGDKKVLHLDLYKHNSEIIVPKLRIDKKLAAV